LALNVSMTWLIIHMVTISANPIAVKMTFTKLGHYPG
jgi:hypothetical protein